jgi:hypothetical protein
LKLIIASVIVLFGVVFFLFALFPSEISVSRIIRINAPRDSVYRQISDLRTWSAWNELVHPSSNLRENISDQADSNRLKTGNLTVTLVRKTADSLIALWQDVSGRSFTGKYILTESGGQTILQWNLEFRLHWYPWEKMASMFYDKQLGPAMERSLTNVLKTQERSGDKAF